MDDGAHTMSTAQTSAMPLRRLTSKADIADWRPEDDEFWESTGKRIAYRNLALSVPALLCGFAVWGLWYSHFVGAEPDGHVTVYQGIPWNLAGNLHLYRAIYVSPLRDVQLSAPERKKLFNHSLRSKSSALHEVRRYEKQIGR